MHLKRGLKRQSCDFCFRRKMKCDRALRRSEAQTQCSHCALREIACTPDLGNVRSRSKRGESAHARRPGSDMSPSIPSRAGRIASPGHGILVDPQTTSVPPLDSDANEPSVNGPDDSINSQCLAVEWPWQDNDWNLGNESISFLDNIFSHDFELNTMGHVPDQGISEDNSGNLPNTYKVLGLDPYVIGLAIEAYFDLASLALPVLLQSAFRVDYRAHRASPALVYAVACRGCPFITTPDKWSIQQQLATCFRRALLEQRAATENGSSIRLDDLEALAIMADFIYDQAEDPSIQLESQLGKLFLTHDSLVLMALQYQILGYTSPSTGPPAPLHGAEERKALLFWHVYGKDAFHTLQRRTPSRIRDYHIESRELLPRPNENETYLDAMLTLAIIARKIRHTFQISKARDIDALHQNIADLYEELAEWRKALPCHLKNLAREDLHPSSGHGVGKPSQPHVLQQTVLFFLEHNCYMQIEAWASEFEIATPSSLDAIMLHHLIEYKALKTAKAIAEAAPLLQSEIISWNTSTGATAYPLVDVAPSILRDICSGTSYWLSNHGKKLLDQDKGMLGRPLIRTETQDCSDSTQRSGARRVESFTAGATLLRNAVAAAASHRDTPQMVETLDEQLSSLKRTICETIAVLD